MPLLSSVFFKVMELSLRLKAVVFAKLPILLNVLSTVDSLLGFGLASEFIS